MEILRFENLSFTYPNNENKALSDISLSVESGDFIVVFGKTGGGKTTLLKMIKKELTPHGKKTGSVKFNNVLVEELDERTAAADIGYVLQNPDSQIVTDKVWHELAFGLENLKIPQQVIRRRVGEMASYFGIQDWFRKSTNELSGGQKQLLNLASVMVMQPKILILDEPTSQLDPIAAADFIATLQKLNREFGLTIIMSSHRLEDVFPVADNVLLIENGKIEYFGNPRNIVNEKYNIASFENVLAGLPSALRIFSSLDGEEITPLTVKEGKSYLSENFKNDIKYSEETAPEISSNAVVSIHDVWFRYGKEQGDVLTELSVDVYEGELFCVLGGNGTGKTTMLNIMSGLYKAYKGKIIINGKKINQYKNNSLYRNNLSLLPQNPITLFVRDSVKNDLEDILKASEISSANIENEINAIAEKLDIEALLSKHPYDLSGGELQLCAIAKLLLTKPRIILLDEPTKGLDAYTQNRISDVFNKLRKENVTLICVTHDIEFAAENASRCALFFDGNITSVDTPKKFFSENNFYTTAANRISRHMFMNAVTCDDVVTLCKRNGNIHAQTNS